MKERTINIRVSFNMNDVPEGFEITPKEKVEEIVKGTPLENKIVEYTPDNHSAPRARKLKELQKQYGNVFFQM